MSFQGRGHSQAYGLFRSGRISNDQICGQRIKAAICAFCAGVKRLEINRDIGPFRMIVIHKLQLSPF